MNIAEKIIIRRLGQQDYVTCWQSMKAFTQTRDEKTVDEIWLLEHPPVFTQGQNGKPEHVLNPGYIPVIQSDRGGQVTYHGPGQLIVYTLIDLKRKQFTVREIVSRLEQSVIDLLQDYKLSAVLDHCAPGVYIDDQKICSIGLRVKRFCTYHGIAFNIVMDLEPFNRIKPCGFSSLKMTHLAHWDPCVTVKATEDKIVNYLTKNLVYTLQTDYDGIPKLVTKQQVG